MDKHKVYCDECAFLEERPTLAEVPLGSKNYIKTEKEGAIMRYVVFACRKCEHQLYVENTDYLAKALGEVSDYDCPTCGEEGFENWVLVGLEKSFPGDKEGGEE